MPDSEKLPEYNIDGKDAQEVLQKIAKAMTEKKAFKIVTSDPKFDPLGLDQHSAHVWIGAAGGGLLMTIGAGALVLAFMDPEPTSKLTLLVGGGILMVLTGGGVVITILVTRAGYTSAMRFDQKTKKYEWVLQPGQ
jgi:hypothetical protein